MKFSNSLKFNAAAEWWDKYIDYASLKRQIYALEKSQQGDSERHDGYTERSALIRNEEQRNRSNDVFLPLLDAELLKITTFYAEQEAILFQELQELVTDVDAKGGDTRHQRRYSGQEETDDDDDDDDHSYAHARGSPSGDESMSRSPTRSRFAMFNGWRSSLGRTDYQDLREADRLLDGITTGKHPNSDDIESATDVHASAGAQRQESSPAADSLSRSIGTRLGSVFRSTRSEADTDSHDIWMSNSEEAWDVRLVFKRRITSLYISFTSLKSYVELNLTGFTKILKKYDKVTENELKNDYLRNTVEAATPFQSQAKDKLSEAVSLLIALYAKCVTKGDANVARRQLRLHQREHIVWERDTIWRQMISNERSGEADGFLKGLNITSGENVKAAWFALRTPLGSLGVTKKFVFLILAVVVFVILLNVETSQAIEERNCLAIFSLCTILWASEAIPLFVTSMLVPMLVVLLKVVKSDDHSERLSAREAAKYIFSVMFSPTIMLLIGGFTIASALSKSNIDKILVTRVLSLAGTRPSIVLLSFMGVSCFASMWISNVAAPTLCFALVKPILRNLPPHSTFGPCLILAIALAANIGGQSSPISSPQNLIALQAMEPPVGWGGWFAVALPVSSVSIVIIWLLLLVSYRPSVDPEGNDLEIKSIRPSKDRFTAAQYYITFVTLLTIVLWFLEQGLESFVGDMGVIALVPVVAFFGTGILKKADFENFLWTVVFLAMGGIALGRAVVSSGLLETLDGHIRDLISGLGLYEIVLVLSAIVLVVSTFISHTVASVLLVPIAAEVGARLPNPHPRLLIMLTALACSTGMGMPVSGFPNQTAATQENDMGQRYLTNMDFLKNGVPASIIAAIVVATVGYLLMRAIGL